MAASTLKVTYGDGTVLEVVATPRAQVETERFLREQGGFADSTVVEASFRVAWESLRSRKRLPTSSSGGDMGYEEWLDMIDDVEEVEPKQGDANPTGPTPEGVSPTNSPD